MSLKKSTFKILRLIEVFCAILLDFCNNKLYNYIIYIQLVNCQNNSPETDLKSSEVNMKCLNCGGEIPASSYLCPHCGNDAQKNEDDYYNRHVVVYGNESDSDGLEKRAASEQVRRLSVFSIITAVLGLAFAVLTFVTDDLILKYPQLIFDLFSVIFALAAFSIGRRRHIGTGKLIIVSVIVIAASFLILAFTYMRH